VSDLVEIEVPEGRVVVFSDLHLPVVATDASTAVAAEIAATVDQWAGPGIVIIAGDGFELLAGPPDVGRVLEAHPQFTSAVRAFSAEPGRQLVILPGNHDGRLAWDPVAVGVLRERLGASVVTLACDLDLDTGDGPHRVRVVHGNQSDPYNTFEDQRSPVDTPLGHHVVQQVLPELLSRQYPGSLLEGVEHLDGDLADFVGSRLLYRKVIAKLWLLATPFVAALILRFIAFLPGVGSLLHHHLQRWLIGLGLLLGLIVLVAAVATLVTLLRVNRALRETTFSGRGDPASHNAVPRAEAARLVAAGYAGMVSGHTHQPELSVSGDGFYANTGSGTPSVLPRASRLRLPRPYACVNRFSYVELVTGHVLEVHLYLRETPARDPVLLERLAMSGGRSRHTTTSRVGSLPCGPTWPVDHQVLRGIVHRRRVRVLAATVLLLSGLLNVLFALLWSVRPTQRVDYWLPFGIHPLSGVGAVVGGIALCGLARGVRRGLQPAWVAALLVLLASSVNRLVQGRGLAGSAIAVVIAVWLLIEHRHFRVKPTGVNRVVAWLVAAGLVAIAVAAGVDALFQQGQREELDAVLLVAFGTVVLAVLLTRPAQERRRTGAARREAFDRARGIIERFGGDTFDYFALRDDKSWFFTGRSVVAYSVINGVMLISPDPIGPPEDRAEVWSDVMDLAQANSWAPSVLAASEPWLEIYRAAGLVDHYIGDEAVVDCSTFSLQGKSMKSLRGAHNRVKKLGYRVEVTDPSAIADGLRRQLLDLLTETGDDQAERGYSMSLSRVFDERDRGLLMAVCYDDHGAPVAFNQYVPARAVNGYALDLTCRTANPDAPNGLTDFVVIETIEWMHAQGRRGLGLNFATTGAVVAGEGRRGTWASLERSVVHRFSDTMQIESLWRFNKKYEPRWVPRYVITGPYLRLATSGLAVARAGSVSELPVVGRLLRPRQPVGTENPT
jgi:lysylphosphatidylglycerol synthetase-like protein (DUF2156 family)/UDP-2,3-diacylglucosamine pyrophosphatase LpxH